MKRHLFRAIGTFIVWELAPAGVVLLIGTVATFAVFGLVDKLCDDVWMSSFARLLK